MNKIIIISIFTGILISGCGEGYYWYKKGATLQQADADCTQCYIDSMSERMAALHDAPRETQVTKTPYMPGVESEFGQQLESISFNNCMKAKGYREVSGDFLNPPLKKKFCSPTPSSSFLIAGE